MRHSQAIYTTTATNGNTCPRAENKMPTSAFYYTGNTTFSVTKLPNYLAKL
jgi:hypothetical protein